MMSTHEHTTDGPCLACLAVVLTAERFSGPIHPPAASMADTAADIAARLALLADLEDPA